MNWLLVRAIASNAYMAEYCMLRPITHGDAKLALGIVVLVSANEAMRHTGRWAESVAWVILASDKLMLVH